MVVIVGPTSSGKTSLAIRLCRKYGGEIISADSRQLYKKMDIGTGKVPVSDEHSYESFDNYWIIDGVKIHGYDLCYPNETYSAADFRNFFDTAKKDIERRKKNPFLVGGTGLYIDVALRRKLLSGVPRNEQLRAVLKEKSVEELQKMLPSSVKSSMNNSDINNPRRLIRKLEILDYGKTQESDTSGFNDKYQIIGLYASNDVLYKRVDRWVDLIWDKLVTEMKLLVLLGYENSIATDGIIYKTVKLFLSGKLSKEDAVSIIKNDLHSYIRRQLTWFKKSSDIRWFDITSNTFFDDVCQYIAW